MINFTIKDDIGNVIYNRVDNENQLTDEEIEQIYKALSDLDSNMVEFSLSKEENNDNSHILYSNSRRCGKSEMLRQCRALCEEYNRQAAALPVCHPAEHAVTGVREPVEPEEPVEPVEPDRSVKPDDRGFVSAPTLKEMLSSDDEIKALHKAIAKVLKRNEFYYEKPYAKDCEDMVDDLRRNTSTFKGYCGDYNQQKQIFGNIPGTYVGCGKHERCEKPNKRAEQEEQCNKKECTETCPIENFIDFLNTYDSWATLIQELQFHSENKTSEKKTELVNKYKKWKREQ